MTRPLRYGATYVSLLAKMPEDIARESVLLYAQAVVRGEKKGKVSVAFGEQTVFNTDVLKYFKGRDEDVVKIISSGMELDNVRDLIRDEGAFEQWCEQIDQMIEKARHGT